MTIFVVGFGMGAMHLTDEARIALGRADYVIAADKGETDPLLAIRREIAAEFDLEIVAVPDPARAGDSYLAGVRDWHTARVEAYRQMIEKREGNPAFLVWGDPAFYDSTLRIVEALGPESVTVIPGISALSLLAARHRIVAHEVGAPLHLTTGRGLAVAIAQGQRNIAVWLNRDLDLDDLGDWSIWWGANLGRPEERLAAGTVAEVLPDIRQARNEVKEHAGWVLDIYLLRAPETDV